MKAYLAGPRTGVPDFNRAAFIDAAETLRAADHTIITPIELDDPDDGMLDGGDGAPLPPDVYARGLEKCIAAMCAGAVEAVIVLPGWEASQGACLEVHVATELGKPILAYPSLEPALAPRHPASDRFHAILRELGALHNLKMQDYGSNTDPFANVRASSEWGMPAWIGAMVRATDKVRRLQSFARKGVLANEGAVDAFDDLAVYAVIARVLYEEETI